MNIFVGNLSRDVTDEDLKELFLKYGEVTSANVIRDKFNGQSRGFGFVEMPSKTAAQSAITELNGKDVKGRSINVNEARPRSNDRGGDDRRRRSNSGGGGGGGAGGPRRRSW
ncbi:MAG: RNA-binding protein [Desulfobacterales bacterium]|nr:RNA-binding protein [Desulfobacterales bacterium]